MESNLLLEQYSRYKKISLEESPYKCLLNTHIDLNPHQINAFIAAIQALKTGGIVLADEVGLGKTIEAGLVLNYVLDSGAKKILIALPATLRKQWEVELEDKFGKDAVILDRLTVEKDYHGMKSWIEKPEVRIIITSYDYASKLMRRFPAVKWDFIIIDEAHNLRNVFHGTKRAKNLYDLSKGIPKILLTATPLQNSLSDLHGLISFIDPKIFGPEQVFNRRFIEGQDYEELKQELLPVLFRTLRKDVGKYMDFKRRECITVDFHLTQEESDLYDLVNAFLKRKTLYSIPIVNYWPHPALLWFKHLKFSGTDWRNYTRARNLQMPRKDLTCSGSLLKTRWTSLNLKKRKTRKLQLRNRKSRMRSMLYRLSLMSHQEYLQTPRLQR